MVEITPSPKFGHYPLFYLVLLSYLVESDNLIRTLFSTPPP